MLTAKFALDVRGALDDIETVLIGPRRLHLPGSRVVPGVVDRRAKAPGSAGQHPRGLTQDQGFRQWRVVLELAHTRPQRHDQTGRDHGEGPASPDDDGPLDPAPRPALVGCTTLVRRAL